MIRKREGLRFLELPLDAQTLERTKACKEAQFPICLNEALVRIFGANGRSILDAVVMRRTSGKVPDSTHVENSKLYEEYMEHVASILGKGVRQVIEFEMLNQQLPLFCLKCPLYERGIERLKTGAHSR